MWLKWWKRKPYIEILSILKEEPSKDGWNILEIKKSLRELPIEEKWSVRELYHTVRELKYEGLVTVDLVKTRFKRKVFTDLNITIKGYGIILFYGKKQRDQRRKEPTATDLCGAVLTAINKGHVKGKAMVGLVDEVQKSYKASDKSIRECADTLKESNDFYMQENTVWKLTEDGLTRMYQFVEERYRDLYVEMQERMKSGEPQSLVDAWGRREIQRMEEEEIKKVKIFETHKMAIENAMWGIGGVIVGVILSLISIIVGMAY